MKFVFAFLFSILMVSQAMASSVDTISIWSISMKKSIKAVVIKPDSYQIKINRFSVVYLLHGYAGAFDNWISRVPEIKNYADSFNCIIVCPDGEFSSWYFDSPIDSTYRYETHISKEVVGYIDLHFKTIANKNHRAITGLSMGGHGALYIAIKHPKVFSVAGSMSGLMDLNDRKKSYDISKRIGDMMNFATNLQNYSVINLIEKNTNSPVNIIFDCGSNDVFIESNRRLHQKMLQLKMVHVFIEKEGSHNWDYWGKSVLDQLSYFQQYFKSH